MKNLALMLILLIVSSCTQNDKLKIAIALPNKSHPLDIDSNISRPVLFYPGTVSTAIDKFNTSFSPNEEAIYYTATIQKLGITSIAYQKFERGSFQAPEFVPFASAKVPYADVHISHDGNKMFFTTFQDYKGKPEGFNFNIWTSEFKDNTWQTPEPLGAPVASKGNEFYPITAENGNLYFNSDRDGNSDIFYAPFKDGKYEEPIKLPENINSPQKEADAFIAKDESYLIFVRVDEPDGFGNSDLYISFKEGDNIWTDPTNLGEKVNSNQIDGSPYVTSNGKYLIFTSGRQVDGIKEKAIEDYKNFQSINSSNKNGSLNFYIMSFDSNAFRKT